MILLSRTFLDQVFILTWLLLLFFADKYIPWCLTRAVFLCWPQFAMTFIVEFWISWVSMLLHEFLIKWRRYTNLWILLVNLVVSGFNGLWMVCLQLLRVNFGGLSLFGPILDSWLVEAIMTLDATVLIKHILRRCLAHYEPVSHFVISLLFVFHIIWVWVILVKCLHAPGLVILLVIFAIRESLVYYEFLFSLSEIPVWLIQIACLIISLMPPSRSIAGFFWLKFDWIIELGLHLDWLVG